ncbi:MAG: hypothetical protein EBS53_17355, partial [Bacteroidetes bacterium]|nr:hypothetical protein [Bacteroidota bacterium]
GENSIKIWYNKGSSGLTYISPATGASNTLAANSWVAYVNDVLAPGFAATGTQFVNTQSYTTGTTATNTVGKFGAFGGSSGMTYDFTLSDIYAADAAPGLTNVPTITSATNVTGFLNIPFNYQITTTPAGATSYSISGPLPTGLNFDSTNGVISGTPTLVSGPTVVSLSASNSLGIGPTSNLSISVTLPINTFSGSDPSLNNPSSWSLSTVNASASIGSFTDLLFASSATNLQTASQNVYAKSWNITNGGSYTFSSTSTNQTAFKFGNTGTNDTYPYSNAVAQAANVLLFLTNGSQLTILPTNTVSGMDSTSQLRNSGIMLIGPSSVADFQTSLSGNSILNAVTKLGQGLLKLSASNSFAGGRC